jgi:hypothetical protein
MIDSRDQQIVVRMAVVSVAVILIAAAALRKIVSGKIKDCG